MLKKNLVVKLLSKCNLIFDPLTSSQGLTLRYERVCYGVGIVLISNVSGQWLLRYESLKKTLT